MSFVARQSHSTVLFYAPNDLYLTHFRPVIGELRRSLGVPVAITGPKGAERQMRVAERKRFVPRAQAESLRWSAVVFSSSRGTSGFAEETKKVLLPHSLGGGKLVEGVSWQYGRERTLRGGAPIFNLILEASRAEAERVEVTFPWLRGTVAGVGLPLLDPLAKLGRRRNNSVLIQTTYGQSSLLEQVGPVLFASEASRIAAALRVPVLVSLHPNHWTGYASAPKLGPEVARRVARGVVVLRPYTPLEHYFAKVGLCITDHTNLSVVAVMLGIPVRVAASSSTDVELDESSPVARVMRSAARIDIASGWVEQLAGGPTSEGALGLAEVRDALLDGFGGAAERAARAIIDPGSTRFLRPNW